MKPLPLAIIAVVVVAFLAVGGFLIFRSTGIGAQAVNQRVTVTGGTMTPDPITVHEGDRVTLTFTVDKKEEIHLHGYDIHFEAEKPGDQVTHTFTADKTGHFDIEIEDTGQGLGSLVVNPR
jgi:hypothetical protein